ncbi:MAG TPA: MlaD family protein [Candidatus Binatia bacterium]
MTDTEENPPAPEPIPKAAVRPRRWGLPVVWIVPIIAVVVAAYLVYERARAYGPTIKIVFKDVNGVKPETPIKHLGVTIGLVKGLELTPDLDHVLITARLIRSPVSVAREGSVFWIVRPELGISSVSGLGTVISGPHIEVLPGTGAPKTEFTGLDNSPAILERNGLRIAVVTNRAGSLRTNSPVYYHGVEVGVVQNVQLAADATAVYVNLFIRQRFAGLVRSGSKFWNVSGVEFNAGLFKGVEIKLESLRSLVAGGIEFATPEDPAARPARNGMAFPLYNEAKKEWLEWSPKIPIPPEK